MTQQTRNIVLVHGGFVALIENVTELLLARVTYSWFESTAHDDGATPNCCP